MGKKKQMWFYAYLGVEKKNEEQKSYLGLVINLPHFEVSPPSSFDPLKVTERDTPTQNHHQKLWKLVQRYARILEVSRGIPLRVLRVHMVPF